MNQQLAVDADRLAQVQAMELSSGGHLAMSDGMCVMGAVAFVAGEPWTDSPQCACPVIATFLRNWNDSLPDDERNDLLKDLIPRLVGTRATPAIEQRRATMAADWLIREHTPAWLRLAGLTTQADALSSLPEITNFAQCPSLMPALMAVGAPIRVFDLVCQLMLDDVRPEPKHLVQNRSSVRPKAVPGYRPNLVAHPP